VGDGHLRARLACRDVAKSGNRDGCARARRALAMIGERGGGDVQAP
jgi:hypothetical protein